jgi:DNA mismatch endonuclease (patch repair protein)
MQTTRKRDTRAEILVRSAAHHRGLRYRVDIPPLRGMRRRADLVFPSARVAVFIDGCFWHNCPEHGTLPRNNRGWWQEKLAGNQLRDRDTDTRLRQAGWAVIRVWEHENPEDVADRISHAVHATRSREPDTLRVSDGPMTGSDTIP